MSTGTSTAVLDELLHRHRELFLRQYGPGDAVRCFYAPGRVNLMGAHLDYNGGPVMPMAIDRGTFLAVRRRPDRRVRMATTSLPEICELELVRIEEAPRDLWSDYPLGVLTAFVRRAPDAGGLDVLFGGNLPVGAGLSSSASICVATAHALNAVWGTGLAPMDIVDTALWAEREFVGVHCGIMDPYAVGLALPGHLLWLDCKDATWRHLSVERSRFAVAVADTGVRRKLARGDFNRRVAECASAFDKLKGLASEATCLRDVPLEALESDVGLTDVERNRARHVLEEVRRTFAARDALLAGELERFAGFMFDAHTSLRDLYSVSVPELDCLVETARATPGVFGSRLTGAGFGGCTVSILAEGAKREFEARAVADFEAAFGRQPKIEFFGGDPGPRELG